MVKMRVYYRPGIPVAIARFAVPEAASGRETAFEQVKRAFYTPKRS
jgi:hypothetical protein